MTPHWSVERSTRSQRIVAWIAAALLCGLALLPELADRATLRLATEIACYLALATAWNLLAGFAGVMSIGQQAFVGIGAYALFVTAGHLGLPPLIAIVLSGAVAMIAAVPIGLTLFRLTGAYFAIASWVMAEIVMLTIAHVDWLGAGSGMSFPVQAAKALGADTDTRAAILWWAGFSVAVLALAISYVWLRSPRGLALMAMRDNEIAAASLGVETRTNKLLVYLVAAGIAGLAGAILFLMKLRISPPAAFDVGEWTANIIFIVVIGGIGFLEGPIIGTIVFFALRGVLSDLGTWYLMLLGTLAILVMLKAPGGIWGFLHSRFGLELFPVSRRLVRHAASPPTTPPERATAILQERIETNPGRTAQRHSSLGLSPTEAHA